MPHSCHHWLHLKVKIASRGHKKQKLPEEEQKRLSCHSSVGGEFYREKV